MQWKKPLHLNIDYDLNNEAQRNFHKSAAMFKFMVGSLGSGKTSTGCVEGETLTLEHTGNVGLVARKSLPELKMTTMKRFFEYLPEPLIHRWNKTDRELEIKTPGGISTVHFGPLDDISRYKSLELGWFFIDEADETTEEMWLTLCGRLRLKGVRLCGMLATNPTTRNHWIYKKAVIEQPPNYEIFHSNTYDNAHHLPDGYIQQLMDNYPKDWQDRYIKGQWGVIQSGDPCFPDFSQDLHVKPVQPLKNRKMLRGWDFGKKRPCCVWAQYDDDNRFRIYRTLLGDNEDIYKFAEKVKGISRQFFYDWNEYEDYCDIAGKQDHGTGKTNIQVLIEKGFKPIAKRSSPDVRIREMCKMMREQIGGSQRFVIDPVNLYLIEGALGGYAVDESGKPKKDGYFDHGWDSVGYIIANTCMLTDPMANYDVEISEPKWGVM